GRPGNRGGWTWVARRTLLYIVYKDNVRTCQAWRRLAKAVRTVNCVPYIGRTFNCQFPPHLCRVKPLRCSDRETASVTLQNLLLALHRFWADQGCVIHIPY